MIKLIQEWLLLAYCWWQRLSTDLIAALIHQFLSYLSVLIVEVGDRLGLLDEPKDGDLHWRLLMKSSLEQKDMVEMQWSQSTERWQILLPGKHCLEISLHRLQPWKHS